jgi:hypothetical protein
MCGEGDRCMTTRVFVSGGIRNGELTEERSLAREAIEQLGLEPIMWETLQASVPDYSKEPYLIGVQICDLYVGIIGAQDAPGAVRELREAAKLDKKLLVLVRKENARQPKADEFLELAKKYNYTEYSELTEFSQKLEEHLIHFITAQTLRAVKSDSQTRDNLLPNYSENYIGPLFVEVKTIRELLAKRSLVELPTSAWNLVNKTPYIGTDPELDHRIAEFYNQVATLNALRAAAVDEHTQNVKSIMKEAFSENARNLNEYAQIELTLINNIEFFLTSGDAYSDPAKSVLDQIENSVKALPSEYWAVPFVSALWLVNKTQQRTKLTPVLAQQGVLPPARGTKYLDAIESLHPKTRQLCEILRRIDEQYESQNNDKSIGLESNIPAT